MEKYIDNPEDYSQSIAERLKLKRQRYSEIIIDEKDINLDLFREYFNYQSLSNMLKDVYDTNKKENKELRDTIKRGLSDLENEIKKISEDEKNEKPDKIVDIVERILYFNSQNQEGRGLKIFTLYQMLS